MSACLWAVIDCFDDSRRQIGVKGIISLSVSKGGKPLAGVDGVHECSDSYKQNGVLRFFLL